MVIYIYLLTPNKHLKNLKYACQLRNHSIVLLRVQTKQNTSLSILSSNTPPMVKRVRYEVTTILLLFASNGKNYMIRGLAREKSMEQNVGTCLCTTASENLVISD